MPLFSVAKCRNRLSTGGTAGLAPCDRHLQTDTGSNTSGTGSNTGSNTGGSTQGGDNTGGGSTGGDDYHDPDGGTNSDE